MPELTAFFSLFTHLFSFGPQSARAGGEVIYVDSIDPYSGVVPTGRRGLGIFPLARVALASEAVGLPGGQPVDHKADPKRSKAKPWRASLARSGARFVPEDGLTAAVKLVSLHQSW